MKTVYILEYFLLDSINRPRGNSVKGVYSSLKDVERAKQELIANNSHYNVAFSIHSENHLFVA